MQARPKKIQLEIIRNEKSKQTQSARNKQMPLKKIKQKHGNLSHTKSEYPWRAHILNDCITKQSF